MFEICLTIGDDGTMTVSAEQTEEAPAGQPAASIDEALEMIRTMAAEGAMPTGDEMSQPTVQEQEETGMQEGFRGMGSMMR